MEEYILNPNGLMGKNNKGLQSVRIKQRMRQLNLQNKRVQDLNRNDISNIKNNKFCIRRQDTLLKDDVKRKINVNLNLKK